MNTNNEYLKSKTFCLYPFSHLNFKVNGSVAPCFRSDAVGNIFNEESDWNGEGFKRVRKELIEGKRPESCNKCWKLEDSNSKSYRMNSLTDYKWWMSSLDDYDDTTQEMKTGPKQIEVRFSNQCNFMCLMCDQLYSSRWATFINNNKDFPEKIAPLGNKFKKKPLNNLNSVESEYRKTILLNIEKWKDSIKHILISGGEPLLQSAHYEMLEKLKDYASDIILDYSSNLSVLETNDYKVLDYWPLFKKIFLRVSIDGDPHVYSYVRKGGDVNTLKNNIKLVKENLDPDKIQFAGTVTTSVYNIARIIECAKFFTEEGLYFHTSLVQTPRYLNIQILPEKEKKEITDKTNDFLNNIEVNLKDSLDKNNFWNDSYRRNKQMDRIISYTKNVINFMNAKDESQFFLDFVKYDKIMNEENNFSKLMPEWKEYYVNV